MLGGELAVHRVHHRRDFRELGVGIGQAGAGAVEVVAHRRAHAGGKAHRAHRHAHGLGPVLQHVHAQQRIEFGRQAREHGARALQLEQAGVEFLLLGLDPAHHVRDHALVLAAQAAQFLQLLDQLAQTCGHQHLLAGHQRVEIGVQLALDDRASRRNQFMEQRRFERAQAAAFEQGHVAADAPDQRLVRRHRIHVAGREAQLARHVVLLARDVGVHRL